MTKKVIAIISVLKPVDDARNYEKVGRSISNTNKYETNIIGFSTKKIPSDTNINFYPIFNFRRISFGRLSAPLKTFHLLLKLKPQLIIVTCADLLLVSILYKILFGSKIIYDVQENYYKNILHSGAYPQVLKYPLAWGVRISEWVSSQLIDKYFLAEHIYFKQIKFLRNKAVVVENKAVIPLALSNIRMNRGEDILFVYSGTIAEHYGIFDAIDLIIQLKSKLANVKLTIIGCAAQPKIYQKLIDKTMGSNYIKIIGGYELVPHDQILTTMSKADFCLLPYQNNKSTFGRIPTKLYECLSMEIPVIISPNAAWDDIIAKNNAGISYDFCSKESFPLDLIDQKFYGNELTSDYLWAVTEQQLLNTIADLIE